MADLDPLIRFRKHTVDEKRRFLAQLYREAEQFQRQKEIIQKEMERESRLAFEMKSPEAAASLGRYLEGARRKIRALEISLRKMDTRIAAAREDMRTAFAEMKKIQIVQRNREEEEKAEEKRKEDIEFGEIAIEGFRRGKDDRD
jgi:flagellar export protein FliJ